MHFLQEFKKVARTTVVTTAFGIKEGRTIRRLQLGEVVEILDVPKWENIVEVTRIRGRVMKDDIEGWITLEGNRGVKFLEDGGKIFKVIEETILTDSFEFDTSSLTESLPKRKDVIQKLAPGDVV